MAIENMPVVDGGPGYVRVAVREREHCSHCPAGQGCGHSLLNRLHGKREEVLTLLLPEAASTRFREGARVAVSIDESRLVGIAVLLYVVPVFFMLIAVALAEILLGDMGSGEFWTVAAGLAGLTLGLFAVRRRSERLTGLLEIEALPDGFSGT